MLDAISLTEADNLSDDAEGARLRDVLSISLAEIIEGPIVNGLDGGSGCAATGDDSFI